MKRMPLMAVLLVAVVAGASAAAVTSAHTTPPKVGQQVPDFTLRDQNGKRIGLAEASGTKAVLVFYRGYW